jgi:predicted Zn-dependent protease
VVFTTVRPGDSWDSLARRASDPRVKASTIAIMNGVTSGTPPRPGDRIRFVAAE